VDGIFHDSRRRRSIPDVPGQSKSYNVVIACTGKRRQNFHFSDFIRAVREDEIEAIAFPSWLSYVLIQIAVKNSIHEDITGRGPSVRDPVNVWEVEIACKAQSGVGRAEPVGVEKFNNGRVDSSTGVRWAVKAAE
jgi:hypothetical protein